MAAQKADQKIRGSAMSERRARLGVLAQAPSTLLHETWQAMNLDPEFELLRGPQTGLVSLRGRIGGGGAPFPFGDATATRASVRLKDGRTGHAMALGRDENRVIVSAVVDALCQDEDQAAIIDDQLLRPLADAIGERDREAAAQVAATRVDFFTMVRGEDE